VQAGQLAALVCDQFGWLFLDFGQGLVVCRIVPTLFIRFVYNEKIKQ
jgi:hypothetical protein